MTETAIRDAVTADIPALHRLIESAYRGEASRAGWTTEADLLDDAGCARLELHRRVVVGHLFTRHLADHVAAAEERAVASADV